MLKTAKLRCKKFFSDESGAIAMNFAIGSVVLSITMSVALSMADVVKKKQSLQIAADAAVLAAAGNVDIALKDREDTANLAFLSNIGDLNTIVTSTDLTVHGTMPTVADPKKTVTATMTVNARTENLFSAFIPKFSEISVTAEAVVGYGGPVDEPPFIEIYVIVDNSASMGIGQTKIDRENMVYDTNIKKTLGMESCAFACHSPSENSYDYYRGQGIRLRIDALTDALTGFVNKIADEADEVTENTRISIIPLDEAHKASSYEFSSSVQSAQTEAQNIELSSAGLTDLQTPLDTINGLIKNVGDGSSVDNPLVYVVLMTDGLEHFSNPSSSGGGKKGKGGSKGGGSSSGNALPILSPTAEPDPTITGTFIQTLDDSHCEALTSRDVRLLVMNVEYNIPELVWDWPVKPWYEMNYKPDLDQMALVNDFLPTIPPTLRNCASTTDDYYQVENESEMNTAFDSIFGDIVTRVDNEILTRLVE